MKAAYWRVIGAILWKDLWMELRRPEVLPAMVVFAILSIFIFNFALEYQPSLRTILVPGLLWLTTAFSGTLGINRSIAIEKDRDSFDALLLAPVERSAVFLGKMASLWLFILIMQAILLPLFGIFYNVDLFHTSLFLVCLLGSLGYVSAGVLMGSISVQTKTQDILLPVLLLPISLPLLIAAVKASAEIIAGTTENSLPWLNFLIIFDLIFLGIAFMVFDTIVEE